MIAYDKRLEERYKREEVYDISQRELIPWEINGQKYNVYGNVNLSIFTTDECNAKCDFCVAELRYLNDGQEYVKPKLCNTNAYLNRLDTILEAVMPLNPSVSITGGEPSLDPKLSEILKVLASHNVRKRTMTTNGAGLLKTIGNTNRTVLDCLIDYELKHLNISRAHFDEERNMQIMNFDDHSVSNKELARIIEISKSNGIRPRLSCVLTKETINSVDTMVDYLDWAESIGVDNIVFRQLMQFDAKRVHKGRISAFIESNQVDLIPLWEELDNDDRFSFINNVLGYYYYVEVFRYKGIDVVSERADLKLIEAEKKRSREKLTDPTIYELVFHPNGSLCGSWREWEDIIGT